MTPQSNTAHAHEGPDRASHRMADLGVWPESADLAHVPLLYSHTVAVGGLERSWDDPADGLRGALVRDDELVHVLVVPGPRG